MRTMASFGGVFWVVILVVMLPCLDVALGQSTDPSEGNFLLACYIFHNLPSCMLLLPYQNETSPAMELVEKIECYILC